MIKKKHFSTFSGVGGFDLALERTGQIETVAFVEKDPYCCAVLEFHWPGKPIYRDIRKVDVEEIKEKFGTIDILTGGFPCQDLSVAGNREGLAGKRSSLWFEFLRLAEGLCPEWVVVENVPGLLSSHRGRDFAVLLRGLVKCGYGVAYRILDAQYFGVPQRRRRVFIVGHLGDGRAAEVLFEREGLYWDTPTRRSPGQEVAGTLKGGSGERGWSDPSDGNGGGLTLDKPFTGTGPFWDGNDRADTLDVSSLVKGQMMPEKHRFPVVIQHSTINRKDEAGAQGKGFRNDDTTWTLDGRGDADVIAYDEESRPETFKQNKKGDFAEENPEVASTLTGYRSSQHRQVVVKPEHPIVLSNDSRGQTAEDGKSLPLTKSDTGTGRLSVMVYENHAQDSRITESENVSPTLHSKMGTGGNNVPLVEGFDARNLEMTGDQAQTVQSKKSGGYSLNYMPTVLQTDGSGMEVTTDGTTPTVLHGGDGDQAHGAYRKLGVVLPEVEEEEDRIDRWVDEPDKIRAIQGDGHSSTAQEHVYFKPEAGAVNSVEAARPHKLITRATIRRFTPVETERLQGFPDGWTAVPNKKRRRMDADDHKYTRRQLEAAWGRKVDSGEVNHVSADSHRYRQMGNAVAIPPVQRIADRLVAVWDSTPPVMPDLRSLLAVLGQGEQLSLFDE